MRDGLRHEALPYAGADQFATSCRDLVRDGLDRDERLIVLAASDKLAAVTDALGPDAADVAFVALDEHGRNPSRITGMLSTFQAGSDGRHCLGVSESVLATRSPAGMAEAALSDFLLNDHAVAAWPMTLVCLFDTDVLNPDHLAVMRQSHAVIRGQDINPEFVPDHAAVLIAADLDPAPSTAWRLDAGADDLADLREFVRANAGRVRLPRDRVDDLVLAANEIVTNSVRYGGGRARVAMWPADRSTGIVCEVRDAGVITDPFIGRFPPPPSASSGRGLWLANHLCDLVQVRSSPLGTTVHLHVDR